MRYTRAADICRTWREFGLETVRTIWAFKAASAMNFLIVTGTCVALVLTIGRAEGARLDALAVFDTIAARTIVLRAEPDAGVTIDIVPTLAATAAVDYYAAFGPSSDVTNAAVQGRAPVAMRPLYASSLAMPGAATSGTARAYTSQLGLMKLGLVDNTGAVTSGDGRSVTVMAADAEPEQLAFIQPLVVFPLEPEPHAAISLLVVTAASVQMVGPTAVLLRDLLAGADPTKVTIDGSDTLADARSVVASSLRNSNQALVFLLAVLLGAMLSVTLYGLVMIRRRDFGRRRALGASRQFIAALVLAQTAIVSLSAAGVGLLAASLALSIGGFPQASVQVSLAIGAFSSGLGVLAGTLPAVAASRRDPLRELRVA